MRTFLLLVSLVLSFSSLVWAETPSSNQKFIAGFSQNYIVPVHQSFVDSSGKLLQNSQALCKEVSEENYQASQDTWKQTVEDWQAVQLVFFGPLVEKNLSWRIQFYYDRKNLVKQKVEALLQGEQALTAEIISQAAVPAQGLPAIEYLLFDPQGGQYQRFQNSPRQCELLAAVSENLFNVSTELNTLWQEEYLNLLLKPHPESAHYVSDKEAVDTIIGGMATKVDELIKKKYLTAFGLHLKKPVPKPYALQFWRSQYSLEAMQAQIAGVKKIYFGVGEEEGLKEGLRALLLAQPEQQALVKAIDESFKEVETALSNSPQPLFTAVKKKDNAEQFVQQRQTLQAFQKLISHDIPKAMNVMLGFNSNDGD